MFLHQLRRTLYPIRRKNMDHITPTPGAPPSRINLICRYIILGKASREIHHTMFAAKQNHAHPIWVQSSDIDPRHACAKSDKVKRDAPHLNRLHWVLSYKREDSTRSACFAYNAYTEPPKKLLTLAKSRLCLPSVYTAKIGSSRSVGKII